METEFNINLHYENLANELSDWYGMQGFEILNKIFYIDLFDYDGDKLEYKLDDLRDAWNELPIEEKIDIYNMYR